MTINELNIFQMRELMGNLSTLNKQNITDKLTLSLNTSSKTKLSKTLLTGTVVRENQDLFIDELVIKKSDEELVLKGQSSWVQRGNTFSLTTQAPSPTRFSAKFVTVVPHKLAQNTLCAIEINLGNFAFDFSNATKEVLEDDIVYSNVALTIYPSSYSISILED